MKIEADFYERPVLDVARELIGCIVEHDGVRGAIVETEAYHESEPACHAFVGVTPRTRTLFAAPGTAYVYRSYGIHSLLNAVCEPEGVGAAVLIRALEPLDGIEQMRARRGGVGDEQLCSGPGKLAQALAVQLHHNATSLVDGPIAIHRAETAVGADGPVRAGAARASCTPRTAIAAGPRIVVAGPRIGIAKAVDLRWRFCLAGNPHVSRPRPAR